MMSFHNFKFTGFFTQFYNHPPSSADDDELEPLDEKHTEGTHAAFRKSGKGHWVTIRRTSLYTIFCANIAFFVVSILVLLSGKPFHPSHCTEKDVSSYSPIFDRLDVKRSLKHFNFTFWPEDPPSIWQMAPSPEVDKAWHDIAESESFPITGDEVRRLGYDPKTVWPYEEEDAGDDAYMAIISWVHQVHCLNMFRMTAFPAYYGDMRERFKGQKFPFEDHLLHCQNILMSDILCHADVEVTIFQKFKGFRGPDVNFGQNKMCRNFEDILEWRNANELKPKGPFVDWPTKPIVDIDPEFILTPAGTHSCQEGQVETNGERHCLLEE